ncbi:MAG: hypothetical protein NW241_02600 [Bacteroidia bacterium]|nr:hypothetical protein [Bacteroidia bacterium]
MKSALRIIGCLLILHAPAALRADRVLNGLNFLAGEWALVGLPLHNYHLLPVQEELGAFISHDREFMLELQNRWDLEATYEAKCDYHYALKLYQNGELIRTLLLNLHCGYLSLDGIDYAFDPEEFNRFRGRATTVAWSRISFSDLNDLRQAIQTLDQVSDVYWYEDVKPYLYPGFIMLSYTGLSWDADLDSLKSAVHQQIAQKTGSEDFYLQEYFHLIRDDRMQVRYLVNCDERLASVLADQAVLRWRNHLYNRDAVYILAIGVDELRYRTLMEQH